jgi:hypothetical protein
MKNNNSPPLPFLFFRRFCFPKINKPNKSQTKAKQKPNKSQTNKPKKKPNKSQTNKPKKKPKILPLIGTDQN